jgi:NADH dehydrogenase (ubiquinone) 1 alpha subcomplex subunit 9
MKRWFSSLVPHGLGPRMTSGPGGRSSVNGLTVTVFGSTGFLGRYVVHRLSKQGNQVIIPYRGDKDDYRHLRPMGDLGQILWMPFHLKDDLSIARALRHADVVINLIGRSYETKNFLWDDVHVTGAHRIATLAREEGVPRMIHVSALNATLTSISEFLRSKAEGEKAVREAYPEATVVRPATLYGFEDQFFNRMAWFRSLPLGFPLYQQGRQHIRPVYVVDVATALHRMVHDQRTSGQIYELYGPTIYSYADLVNYFEKMTYRSFRRLYLPRIWLQWLGAALDLFPRSTISRDEVIRMGIDDTLDPAAYSWEQLGIEPTPVERVAIQFLRGYRSNTYYDEPLSDTQYYGSKIK